MYVLWESEYTFFFADQNTQSTIKPPFSLLRLVTVGGG